MYKLSNEKIFDIKVCVDEAVRNAIVHGNKSDRRLYVRVLYWVKDGKVNIEVEDEGKGYNPKKLPDPTVDENITRNCGRGVYLIKKLMDKVEFNETGNVIKMMKKLN